MTVDTYEQKAIYEWDWKKTLLTYAVTTLIVSILCLAGVIFILLVAGLVRVVTAFIAVMLTVAVPFVGFFGIIKVKGEVKKAYVRGELEEYRYQGASRVDGDGE